MGVQADPDRAATRAGGGGRVAVEATINRTLIRPGLWPSSSQAAGGFFCALRAAAVMQLWGMDIVGGVLLVNRSPVSYVRPRWSPPSMIIPGSV